MTNQTPPKVEKPDHIVDAIKKADSEQNIKGESWEEKDIDLYEEVESIFRKFNDGFDKSLNFQYQADKYTTEILDLIKSARKEERQAVVEEVKNTPKLDHHCKCEGSHLISFKREDYDKLLTKLEIE